MDVDEFQSQIYTGNNKYPRLGSTTNNNNGTKLGPHYPPEEDEEDDAHTLASNTAAASEPAEPQSLVDSMFRGWHNSSRIFRVSRASGGKDRHSKVLTSKGLRDRRVRLSVSTAIQFYDLQDRLGYDQPSKAVEWLIKAAADSIAELPSLHGPFPETPRQVVVDSKLGFDSAEAEAQQQKLNLSISKSASSTSETSKGSGLSLTRTDVRVNQRVKARERARERAKEKECESEQAVINVVRRQTANPISSHPNTTTSSFTELLTGGNQSGSSPNSTPMMMDYFTGASLISGHHATASQPTSTSHHHHHHHQAAACLFLGQSQMGNSMSISTAYHLSSREHNQQHYIQHLSFGQENLIPVGNEYDLNFRISSSPSRMAGYNNRGTLQSNTLSAASSMLHQNFQRYPASMEGSNVPAFFVSTQPSSSNQHNFSTGFNGGLHLCYGDEGRHADLKDKGKK